LNRILVVEVDNKSGALVTILQDVSPVAPNTLNLKEGIYNGIATEWISRHPTLPLLYALTSYWNAQEACVTTFNIHEKTGLLTQLGIPASTGGYHAAHATFSSDGSLLVIAHHNDGKIVFFDTSEETAIKEPCCIMDTPEVVPGTRRTTKPNDGFPGLPSLHHVTYGPNQKYLLTVDPSQDCIFTYAVNEQGLPTSKQPTSILRCLSPHPIIGWFQRAISNLVLKCHQRARKVAVHPNGKYLYVLYESINRLQIYSIDAEGIMDASQCWQDVSTLESNATASDDDGRTESCYDNMVGIALQLASELYVTKDGSTLLVANRGDTKVPLLARAESSIRAFRLDEEGRKLVPLGCLSGVDGPVRHFVVLGDTTEKTKEPELRIVAGVFQSRQCLQTYVLRNRRRGMELGPAADGDICGDFELLGEASLPETNVFCIAPMEQEAIHQH